MQNYHPAHIQRFPFFADMTEYPFMFYTKERDPVLEYRTLARMPKDFRSRWAKFIHENNGLCFYSHARVYGFSPLLDGSKHIPWGVSKDHLVPVRHMNFMESEFHPLIKSSTVLVGKYVNHYLGHVPLAVRSVIMNGLRNIDINRHEPTVEDAKKCKHAIVDLKQGMRISSENPHYIWQEVETDAPHHRRQSRACFAEMLCIERTFLQMPHHERVDWLEKFQWKW